MAYEESEFDEIRKLIEENAVRYPNLKILLNQDNAEIGPDKLAELKRELFLILRSGNISKETDNHILWLLEETTRAQGKKEALCAWVTTGVYED